MMTKRETDKQYHGEPENCCGMIQDLKNEPWINEPYICPKGFQMGH